MSRSFLAAAAVATVLSAGGAARAQSILTFNADWTTSQTAPLIPGQQAILRYDVNRLPSCRASHDGGPAWAIAGYLEADDSSTVPSLLIDDGHATGNPVDVSFTVPYGADLSVWFHDSDEAGCSTWDSSYGANYHFPLQGPTTLHFNDDWTDQVAGALTGGQPFVVDYDIRRLASCRADYSGYDAYSVSVQYRFDGGAVSSAELTQNIDPHTKAQAPALLNAPAGAHQLEMWFENDDADGCLAWDSQYGANYTFSVQ